MQPGGPPRLITSTPPPSNSGAYGYWLRTRMAPCGRWAAAGVAVPFVPHEPQKALRHCSCHCHGLSQGSSSWQHKIALTRGLNRPQYITAALTARRQASLLPYYMRPVWHRVCGRRSAYAWRLCGQGASICPCMPAPYWPVADDLRNHRPPPHTSSRRCTPGIVLRSCFVPQS